MLRVMTVGMVALGMALACGHHFPLLVGAAQRPPVAPYLPGFGKCGGGRNDTLLNGGRCSNLRLSGPAQRPVRGRQKEAHRFITCYETAIEISAVV